MLSLFSAMVLAACATHHPATGRARPVWISGQATVVQVDNTLGTAVLKYEGHDLNAFWDTQVVYGQGQSGDVKAGIARDPLVRNIEFPAKVGDTVAFSGLMTDHELLLRAVQVLHH